MNNKIVLLLKEFQQTVKEATILLNEKYEKEPNFDDITEDSPIRHGFLDDKKEIKYHFHGVNGCIVQWPNGRFVDFNLGMGGRCDGLDLGFVHNFFEKNADINQHYKPVTFDDIKETANLLMNRSEMMYDRLFNLYYFVDDYNNKNPYKWHLNARSTDFYDVD